MNKFLNSVLFGLLIVFASSFSQASRSCKMDSGIFQIKKGQDEFFKPPKRIELKGECDSSGAMTRMFARYQGNRWGENNPDGWTQYKLVFECDSKGCGTTDVCYPNGYCQPYNGAHNYIEIIDQDHFTFYHFQSYNFERR